MLLQIAGRESRSWNSRSREHSVRQYCLRGLNVEHHFPKTIIPPKLPWYTSASTATSAQKRYAKVGGTPRL